MWKNADEIEASPPDSKIKGNAWYSHFSTLHTESSKDKLENLHADISKPFTKKEFKAVIKV